jgi:hypothetical protein
VELVPSPSPSSPTEDPDEVTTEVNSGGGEGSGDISGSGDNEGSGDIGGSGDISGSGDIGGSGDLDGSGDLKFTSVRTDSDTTQESDIFECPEEIQGMGMYGHPDDCRAFFKCVKLQPSGHQKAFQLFCPTGFIFNPLGQTCDLSIGGEDC